MSCEWVGEIGLPCPSCKVPAWVPCVVGCVDDESEGDK
jgi:hypothetical protein